MQTASAQEIRAPGAEPRFAPALAGIVLLAFAVRVAYVLIARRHLPAGGDGFFYHEGANLLVEGKGFIEPFAPQRRLAAAEHPPLYLLYLAIPSLFGMKSVLTHRLWSCVAGAATVLVIGLTGRKVGTPRTGLIAAALAAVYPNMWLPDGMLQAETVAMLITTLAVWLAYDYWRKPSWARLGAVGAMCGLAALTRSELILLVPALVIPLALLAPGPSAKTRLTALAVGVVAAVIVVTPWSAYNATRFRHVELLSTQLGPLLSSANCDSAYFGYLRGYFDNNCTIAADTDAGIIAEPDQSVHDLADRRAAAHYARGHLSAVPLLASARALRAAALYHPSRIVAMDHRFEGREKPISWIAVVSLWALGILAIVGAVLLHRGGRAPVFPLLAVPAVVLITVIGTYASTRFRAPAEPSIVILAAITIDHAIDRVRQRRRVVDAERVRPVGS